MTPRNPSKHTAAAALIACALVAPSFALAQDARYVPAYEPAYVPPGYSLLGAYGLSSVSLSDAYGRQNTKRADFNIAPIQVTHAARQMLDVPDLQAPTTLSAALIGPTRLARSMVIASR